MPETVEEQLVERDLDQINRIFNIAWRNNLTTTEALLERLRIEIMVKKPSRRRRAVYRALIDYIDDALDQRYEKEEGERPKERRQIIHYIRGVLDDLDS